MKSFYYVSNNNTNVLTQIDIIEDLDSYTHILAIVDESIKGHTTWDNIALGQWCNQNSKCLPVSRLYVLNVSDIIELGNVNRVLNDCHVKYVQAINNHHDIRVKVFNNVRLNV